ncbi:MAG: superoxide dismutase [Pseudonocardiaceae bacterium]
MRRRLTLAMVAAVMAAAPTACAYKGLSMAEQTAFGLHGDGTLAAASGGATAVTYNPQLAPVGAQMKVTMIPSGESTIAELTVSGLQPNRGYAVNAHVNACGGVPGGEGPHFQNRIDPAATNVKPSRDPAYANPTNEIWLDVRTDGSGSGSARTTVPFLFTDRGPGSIVVHEATETATGPGQAGNSGDRVACLTLSAATPKGADPRGS